jgi:hypothetical protein
MERPRAPTEGRSDAARIKALASANTCSGAGPVPTAWKKARDDP